MKSRVLGVLVLLFSLAAFAGKVPQAELDRVNGFIGQLLGGFSQYVQVEVTKAGRSNKTNLLTSANVQATIMGVAKVDLGLQTKKKDIVLSGGLEGRAADLGLSIDDVKEELEKLQKFVEAINKAGDYTAELAVTQNTKGVTASFEMKPTKANKKPSVKKLVIKGSLPTDTYEVAKFSIEGTMNGGADNVMTVRTSITNIFNSLASEEMPNDADFEALGQVLETMFKALEEIEDVE